MANTPRTKREGSQSPRHSVEACLRSDASEVEVGDYIEMVRGFDRMM